MKRIKKDQNERILERQLDDFDPEVLAYWAKRGMVKEAHGRDQKMEGDFQSIMQEIFIRGNQRWKHS